VTILDIFYDINTGQLRHYMKLRLEVTLDDDRDEGSVRAILEVIDPQGVVLQSRTGAASLVRIPFRAARVGRALDGSVATSAMNGTAVLDVFAPDRPRCKPGNGVAGDSDACAGPPVRRNDWRR
jgi:hypothetical protein